MEKQVWDQPLLMILNKPSISSLSPPRPSSLKNFAFLETEGKPIEGTVPRPAGCFHLLIHALLPVQP